MIYAAKPSNDLSEVILAVGISDDDWIETNELETILQFVTRTSIRDPESKEAVRLYVFDEDQAHYLMRFFSKQPHVCATVDWIDLDLDFRPEKSGPKRRPVSPEEACQKQEARRKQKAGHARQRRAKEKMLKNSPVVGREPWTPIPLI